MKKSLKAIIAICLVVVLAGSIFAACTAKPQGEKIYQVGVVQLTEHPALDAATEGFVAALKDKLGDQVKVDIQTAQGEETVCATIANQLVSKGVDLIMANATPALQAAVAATDQIPIVATSITDYGEALGVSDFTGKSGINVTGTSDLAPLDGQAKMIPELCPNVKTVGIIYCSSEANSKYQATGVAEALSALGIATTEYTFADSNDIQAVVTKAVAENDALYIPTDNKAADNTGIIDSVARPAKCPVFAGEEGICKVCGIATLSISYYDLGYKTGEMAAEILTEGKEPGTMDIAYAPKFTKEYNVEICAELGIEVSDEYVAIAAE